MDSFFQPKHNIKSLNKMTNKLSQAQPTTVGDLKYILGLALQQLSKIGSSLPISNVIIDHNKGDGVLYGNIKDFNVRIESVTTPTGVEFDVVIEFVGEGDL